MTTTWLAFIALEVLFSVAYQLLSRKLSVRSENPRAFSVVFNAIAAAFSFLFVFYEPWRMSEITISGVALMLLSTVFYAVFERTQFYARKHIEASTLTILFRFIPVVSVVAAVLFYGDNLTPMRVIAIALIVMGNLLVVFHRQGLRLSAGLPYALVAAISLGLAWANDKHTSVGFSLSLYAFLIWTIPTIYNVLIPPLSLQTLHREFVIGGWKIFLLAVLNVFDYYFLLKALSLADTSQVIPVQSSSTILVVLFGWLFLHEQQNIGRKIFAALCVTIGVVFISRF